MGRLYPSLATGHLCQVAVVLLMHTFWLQVFGMNELGRIKSKSFLTLAWENLQDPILLLLLAAALVRCCMRCMHVCAHAPASENGHAQRLIRHCFSACVHQTACKFTYLHA